MRFPLFVWESAERGGEGDSCELARSTVVFANWHILLSQHNFGAGLQEYIVEGQNRKVAGEAIISRQSPNIALTYPCLHAHGDVQTAGDEPAALVTSHVPFVCLCVFPLLPPSIFLGLPSIVIIFYRNIKSWFKTKEPPHFPHPLSFLFHLFFPWKCLK